MIDIASLTADQWLSATGWNLRTLRQYPDKALRVLAEQSARAERLEVALAAERARADQADAKVASVEALRDKWMHDGEQPDLWIALNRALSAAPTTEQ